MSNTYSPDVITKILPEKLKEFRLKNGFTIKQIGQMLNKTTAAVSLWENGRALPDVKTLLSLCKIYNIQDFNEFLEIKPQPELKMLTKSEQQYIKLWRSTPVKIQNAIITIMQEFNKK